MIFNEDKFILMLRKYKNENKKFLLLVPSGDQKFFIHQELMRLSKDNKINSDCVSIKYFHDWLLDYLTTYSKLSGFENKKTNSTIELIKCMLNLLKADFIKWVIGNNWSEIILYPNTTNYFSKYFDALLELSNALDLIFKIRDRRIRDDEI